MIKIDVGHLKVMGTPGAVIYDLVTLLLAINDQPELQEFLEYAEAELEKLVKEGNVCQDILVQLIKNLED